jgi:putative ABC transport system ATP-binding protein
VTPAIEAQNLYRFFHTADDEVLALRGVSLTVAPGEMLAVTGPSGSGKSTLLTCMAGLDEPDGGMVRVLDEPLTRRPESERATLRARRVGLVFQSGNLLAHLRVVDNVTVAQRLAGRSDARRPAELLDKVGLGGRGNAYPPQLSGGEAARAAVAVALANEPAVLLADEPTGELDAGNEDRVLTLLRACADAGGAVVVATHSRAVAAGADRTVSLRDGELTP